ncbi:uncharacterized protein LOC112566162 [Pomacea canaliculata]|uniref:uncharacterized protein LOC112566162 n=1 Tax=Pomacea canaliculata TaxID=400727 RepID=UPI000D734F7A|nr:uncharacterized protein LOC112566162 [Pomacea canaliculata]
MSKTTYEIINDVVSGCLALAISVVGIPANLVTCLVFWRQGLRDRMNLCLFCLAAVDLLYLMPVLSVGPFLHLANNPHAQEYTLKILNVGLGYVVVPLEYNVVNIEVGGMVEWRLVPTQLFLENQELFRTIEMSVLTASLPLITFFVVFITAVITVIKLTAAAKWRRKTSSTCRKKLGYTVIPLMYHVASYDVDGRKRWHYVPTQMFLDNKDLFETVELTVLTVSLPITTFLVVSVTAVITVIKLTAALKWREKTSSTTREKVGRQTALTKMILLVSVIYICSMLPSVSLSITRLLVDGFSPDGGYYNLFMGTHIVANVCPMAHSASNFFVYYSRSSRFKSSLADMF